MTTRTMTNCRLCKDKPACDCSSLEPSWPRFILLVALMFIGVRPKTRRNIP